MDRGLEQVPAPTKTLDARFRDLRSHRFRIARDRVIRRFDELEQPHQEAIRREMHGVAPPGVLVSRSTGHCVAVDAEVLQLLWAARQPARLPAPMQETPHPRATVLEMVLDGLLEVELETGFGSGPAVYPALVSDPGARTEPVGVIADLSMQALRHGAAISAKVRTLNALTRQLYAYKSAPTGPEVVGWQREHGDLLVAMYAQMDPWTRARLDARYGVFEHDSWWLWSRRDRIASLSDDARTEFPYKLYVSARPMGSARAALISLDVLASVGVEHVKIARGLDGLARPDRFLAYFRDRDALFAAAAPLAIALEEYPAQGVPFSCTYEPDAGRMASGLLTWGLDPPVYGENAGWVDGASWRHWLCRQLARALLQVREQGMETGVDAVAYALDRMLLAGVDIATWTPDERMFTGPEASTPERAERPVERSPAELSPAELSPAELSHG